MDWQSAKQLDEHLPKLSESQKERVKNGVKIKVCEEQRENWSGKLPFYIFWCEDCENFAYDYPHGYIEVQYLICHRCNNLVDFRPWWAGWVLVWGNIKLLYQIKFGGKR